MSSETLVFFLNGTPVEIVAPAPDLLLLDYLRSPEVGLIGPKKGCGQGGCGACTVILSQWNPDTGDVEHRAINSCLRPVSALQGLSVTTIEGTGAVVAPTEAEVTHPLQPSRGGVALHKLQPVDGEARRKQLTALASSHPARSAGPELLRKRRAVPARAALVQAAEPPPEGMNPVAHRLAVNNGSQCGYCSAGFVMTMTGLLANNASPTKRQIEDTFDGNLCRCTGYRPILTAMKTFASDWSAQDEADRMKCKVDPAYGTTKVAPLPVTIPFPPAAKEPRPPLSVERVRTWKAVTSIAELCAVVTAHPDAHVRLVHGNTSFGVYPEEFHRATLLIDIRGIAELGQIEVSEDAVRFGAGVTYDRLIETFEQVTGGPDRAETTRIGALDFMARRTAGALVRNAASVGGNSALVLEHIHPHTGDPFPSDLFTAMDATDVRITTVDLVSGKQASYSVEELCAAVLDDATLPGRLLLVDYSAPMGKPDSEIVLAQKVALREVNSHTIVNCTTRLSFAEGALVEDAVLSFGGIAPFPFRARQTEEMMRDTVLSLDGFPALAACLQKEVEAEQALWAERMAEVPNEGFTDEYRRSLAVNLLYKAIVNALDQRAPATVPPDERSSGVITWGRWPVSDGRQSFKTQGFRAPVGEPFVGFMTLYQTSGEVHYTHEARVPASALDGAIVQSTRTLGTFHWQLPKGVPTDPDGLRAHLEERFHDFVTLLTASDIPRGGQNLQGMGADQPLFSPGQVLYLGQSLGMVLARDELRAQEIADYVAQHCVGYGPIDWPPPFDTPILGIARAIELGSIFPDSPASAPFTSHIWRIVRPGSVLDWVAERSPTDRCIEVDEVTVNGVPCRRVSTSAATGGQLHFYMETQACVARPEDGNVMQVNPSSQSPQEMHQTSAAAIGVPQNRIRVKIHQLGGGYGGKTEQARFITGPAVVAADVCNRTVRLVMKRESDSALLGKRHPYYGQAQVALDTGDLVKDNKGLIQGLELKLWGDGGAYYDCSFIVSNNIMVRADNAYKVPNTRLQIDVCRTNTAPNTAMRSFGDVQSTAILESALDDAAFALGMSAEEVRRKNLYQLGDVNPFGQALTYCYMREVWDLLAEVAKFDTKKAEIEAFNASNRWRKRGIAMVPVKYGSGYNLALLEQASALVSVFQADGTVLINQGGVDMGQGSLTQVLQVASYILGVPMSLIRIEMPDTGVVPNPTSTGASTGTAYNAEAVKGACTQLRDRLTAFGYEMRIQNGEEWCVDNGIDFWNHGEKGWAAETTVGGRTGMIWSFLVALAYTCRINLSAQFQAPMRGADIDAPALEFKPSALRQPIPGVELAPDMIPPTTNNFVGFTYSAACTVVEVDVLTGEHKILSTDLMYDMGWSMNPALDIGQVEGAYIQGVGYLLEEWMVFQDGEGDDQGRLNTLNTWRYKLPAITSIPLQFNTHLFPRDRADVPDNPNELLSAKEVGEPPLVLGVSAFLALKQAVRASRVERGLSGLFRFDAPATVQAVQTACEVDWSSAPSSEES